MNNKNDNEALKEIGKGFINLGNIAGGLSFVNVFLQKEFSYIELGLVAYMVVTLYIAGYKIIKRSMS